MILIKHKTIILCRTPSKNPPIKRLIFRKPLTLTSRIWSHPKYSLKSIKGDRNNTIRTSVFVWQNLFLNAPLPLIKTAKLTAIFRKRGIWEHEARIALPIFWDTSVPKSSASILKSLFTPSYPRLRIRNEIPLILPLRTRLRHKRVIKEFNTKSKEKFQSNQIQSLRLPTSVRRSSFSASSIRPPVVTLNPPLLQAISLAPRWNVWISQIRITGLNLHRIDWKREVTTDFPRLGSMFSAARTHFHRFLGKLRRLKTDSVFSPLKRFYRYPAKSYTNPIIDSEFLKPRNWEMRRIRFKPGISRLWRIARRDLKIILDFPVRYQHRLTWRLTKIARTRNAYVHFSLHHQLQFLLIRLRLVSDLLSAWKWLRRGAVFLNGTVSDQGTLILLPNDRINLILSLEYYTFNLRLHLSRHLVSPSWFKLIRFRSMRSCYRVGKVWFPSSATNKFNHLAFIWDDTPPFFQLDFFTLSCFVLRETPPSYSSALGCKLHTPFAVLNVYNWKYIT
uniref:Ribosomal protein S4 n=1 Tax=Urostyla grandis TaxID=57509 RepID=A0A2I4PEQ4_9SPIT|nr:ribosomal protein S4 [Urostyla grandis]